MAWMAGAMVALATVAGCSSDNSATGPAVTTTVPRVSAPGPFFGECGSVGDDEVASVVGEAKFPTVFRNSVGCVWQIDAGLESPMVSFSWYRGSPMGREAAGSHLIGRPPDRIEIRGHRGFRGSDGAKLCEIGVEYGDDFFHWSVNYGVQDAVVPPCGAATRLADLTASRVK